MAVEKCLNVGKKGSKKSYYFLNGPALYPPLLLMARPLRDELFFAASLSDPLIMFLRAMRRMTLKIKLIICKNTVRRIH